MQALRAALFATAVFADEEIELHPYAWQFQGEDYTPFPESVLPELKDRSNIGIAFSGGGTRAQIAAMGELKGLHDIGILKHVKYMTGVSGGSWAIGAFAYATTPEEDFLGDYLNPENITMQALAHNSSVAGRFFGVNRNFATAIIGNIYEGYNVHEVWMKSVSEVYLEPAGVKWGAFFSWSDREIKNIIERNPSLGDNETHWATVGKGRPYPIMGMSLISPECTKFDWEYGNKSQTVMESTPLYVGEAHTRHMTYRGYPVVTRQIGGFIEPFAFGADEADSRAHLPSGISSGLLQGVKASRASCSHGVTPKSGQCNWPWSLAHAIGASSWVPGEVISENPILGLLDIGVHYWSPATPLAPVDKIGTAGEGKCGVYALADGGCTTNGYLVGLIKRRVKTIVAFWNLGVPLAPQWAWDPAVTKSSGDFIDDAFASIFGQNFGTFGTDYYYNQIFSKEDYVEVVKGMQKSQAAGTGAVFAKDHVTVENKLVGIPAGIAVKVVWVYLSRAWKFEEAISDAEVKAEAFVPTASGSRWDPRVVPSWKPFSGPNTFTNFPHWQVATQIHVGVKQANLMSHLTAWTVKQHTDVFYDALAHAFDGKNEEMFV